MMLCQAMFLLLLIGIKGKDHTTPAMFDFVNRKITNLISKLCLAILIEMYSLLFFLAFIVLAVPHVHRRKDFVKPQVKLHSKSDLETIDQLVQESTELENGLRILELNLTEVRFRRSIKKLNRQFDRPFISSLHWLFHCRVLPICRIRFTLVAQGVCPVVFLTTQRASGRQLQAFRR